MTAKEFLLENGYDEDDQGEGYILTVKELELLLLKFSNLAIKECLGIKETKINQ